VTDASRILFLDDDPVRATAFLTERPHAVWVQTAEQCLAHLTEPWDEVHLDHDLGGEVFVDHERDDCGMAVVRWLCAQPQPHLQATQFFIHTHNPNAACVMTLHLQVMGFDVRVCPFGTPPPAPHGPDGPRDRPPLVRRLVRWLQGGR
jgi:hypothetical protein